MTFIKSILVIKKGIFPWTDFVFSIINEKKLTGKAMNLQYIHHENPDSKSSSTGSFFLFFPFCIFLFLVTSGCSTISTRHEDNSAIREKIVQTAMKYKGCPYRSGGSSPKGFDCSGFTSFVYNKAGIRLPRTSKDQYKSGDDVDFDEMQKGDLVFFTRWRSLGKLFSPNHVGIFIGNDRFIHAPSSGGRVRVDRLGDDYWDNHYKGSRDVID